MGGCRPLSQIFSGRYLVDRFGRLRPSIESTLGWLVNSIWTYAAPALLGVAILCFVVRVARPVAAYYVASVTLMICALLWMDWTGDLGDLSTWRHLTGQRDVGTVAITSASGVEQLASSLLARAPDAHAPADERATLMAEWLGGVTEATPAGRSRVSLAQSRPS